jgi:creatinine amidohydrolase
MMLRIAPHLVGDLQSVDAVSPGMVLEPASHGWITKDRSAAGHIGNPRHATAEKGEVLYRVFSDDVVAFLERVAAWDGRGIGA